MAIFLISFYLIIVIFYNKKEFLFPELFRTLNKIYFLKKISAFFFII